MDKYGLITVLLLLFMIVLDRSNALNSRKLVTKSDANQGSPLPSPLPNEKKHNLSPAEERKPTDTPMANPSDVESKGLNDTNTKKSSESSSNKKLDNGKSQDDKENINYANKSKTIASESCKGNPICRDHEETMIACIQDFDGSNKLTLFMQNERNVTMKVNLTFMTSVNNSLPSFEIPAHGIEKVNTTFSGDKSTKVILNAGHGDCELRIGATNTTDADSPEKPKEEDTAKSKEISKPKEPDSPTKPKDVDNPPMSAEDVDHPPKSKEVNDPSKSKEVKDTGPPTDSKSGEAPPNPTSVDTSISQSNLFKQLSFYSKQVTPIYGAYIAFLAALIMGGSWAFCSFRKRRTDGGVTYQELEMGLPESSNAVDLETVEGWDADWDDDDWDEDKAIRSPGGGIRTKSISSNGITSRGTQKDGWDEDWDD